MEARTKEMLTDLIVYLFIILFMYTAASKILTIDKFASTLAKSPLIGSYNVIVAWAIPILEIAISLLLIVSSVRKWGLVASLVLMSIFTLYLLYMVFSGNKLPCHCGGVISTMTWQQHIWFNLGFVILAVAGLVFIKRNKELRA
ncbi:MAG: hypothetical protein EOO88_20765 [Pedobacter sp.]|nr:MAG: hypothetical protein EOO88_20765 [Pedobacter sp.]